MQIKLVGGPFDEETHVVPDDTPEWRGSRLTKRPQLLFRMAVEEPLGVPEKEIVLYRRDRQWREFEGYEPIPFVYVLPSSEEREGA